MKLRFFICVIFFVITSSSLFSLSNFDYWGIAFSGSGNILASQTVTVNIKIIKSSGVVYEENHTGITTNQFGAYSVTVGTGTVVSGDLSTVSVSKEMKIESTVNNSGTWVVSSFVKLNTAAGAANISKKHYWSVSGNSGTTAGTDFIGTKDGTATEIRVENAGTSKTLNSLVLNANGSVQRDNPSTGGSYTAGNSRGTNAVDLQAYRESKYNIASGVYSVIGGGSDNEANDDYTTVAGGRLNYASDDYNFIGGGEDNYTKGNYSIICGGKKNKTNYEYSTVIGGYYNLTQGKYATVLGGQENTARGDYSTAMGYEAFSYLYGQFTRANGSFSNTGDAQVSEFVLRKITTDATTSSMYLDGSSAEMSVPSNTSWLFTAYVIARNNAGESNSKSWKIVGMIDQNGIYGVTTTVIAGTPSWTATADKLYSFLRIRVTGASGVKIYWVARVKVVEVHKF